MFNLGFTHILLLGVIALIVVGPEQLPDLAKKLAKMLNDLRRAKDEILGPVTNLHNETQKMIDDAKSKATLDINKLLDMRAQLDNQIIQASNQNEAAATAKPEASVPTPPIDPAKKDSDGH